MNNNTFTDEEILWLNENDFNGNQIDRLEALALNLNLDLDNVYDDIRHIINAYPPEPPDPHDYPDFEIRISNEMLIRLLENEYSFEEIESLLEYNFIDIDFEWLLDNPNVLYEDVYHMLEDGLSFDEIKNEFENIPQDDDVDNDEPDMGGKRRKTRTRRRKQSKTKQRKQSKSKKRKQRKSKKRRKY